MAPLFEALQSSVHVPCEILIVFDADDDPTIQVVQRLAPHLPFPVCLVKNNLGPGPANALRSGFAASEGEAVVVVAAYLCDEVALIDQMVEQLNHGYDLVCASRYVPGGRQVGGPWLKRTCSRLAGISLRYIFGLPTHDVTNGLSSIEPVLLRSLAIESSQGWEISMEITVKAWAFGWRISELPTTWVDRVAGQSKFRLWRWLPRYLRWYLYAVLHGRRQRISGVPQNRAKAYRESEESGRR